MSLLENYLNVLQEYDEEPNLVGYCINTYSECPQKQISCLRILQQMAAQNPEYQCIIDRHIDAITGYYEPTDNPGYMRD